MSKYSEKRTLEDYMVNTYGQFDDPSYAKGLPVVLDNGIIFLSSALTTQLMKWQKVKEIYDIELYYSTKRFWDSDLEFTTKQETSEHQKISLYPPFRDTYIRYASYCDNNSTYEDLKRKQDIVLDKMPWYHFGPTARIEIKQREVFTIFIIKDIIPMPSGGITLTFHKVKGEEDS